MLGPGESATCGNCGKAILGPGAWGINPAAVCHCCSHDQRPLSAKPQGCICPPGSEATCQGLSCPRRGLSKGSLSGAGPLTGAAAR